MPLQSFVRVGCLRIGSSRCSSAAFLALIARIPAAKQTHARVRASHLSLKSHLLSSHLSSHLSASRRGMGRRGRGKGHRAEARRSHDSANSPERAAAAA